MTLGACGDDDDKGCLYPLHSSQAQGISVECVDLVVPGKWDQPDSKEMNLHVAVFRANPEAPTPRAWLWILGGPGQSWAKTTEVFSTEVMESIGQDLIIVDQRGVGFNSPKLDCSATSVDDAADIGTFIAECVKDLRNADVPIEGFTTWDMARDIEAARIHFGYTSLDLFGVSYGTRLAFEYLRRYPQTTHAMVLDSVSSPPFRLFETGLRARQEALEELFLACEEESACQQNFPELEAKFEWVYAQLEEQPITMVDQQLDGDGFVGALISNVLSFHPAAAPAVIFELADAIEADQDVPVAIAELFGAFNVTLDESSGEELLVAVNCVENQGVSLETIQAQKDDVRPSLHSLASVVEEVLYPACLEWPSVAVPNDAFDYVSNTDVPVLLLSGRLDPRTPLSEAIGARETLGNVTHVIVDHQGHSLATKAEGCLFRYGMNFLLNGEPAEELGCDATLNPPFFETVEEAVEAL